MAQKTRVLTGIRPTGPLHLGHYVGALSQWLQYQAEGYECFFLIADAQALTDHAHEPRLISRSVLEVALDWLAVGLDPKRCAFTVQSWIPATPELEHLLASITPWSWIQRNPTLKAEIKELEEQRGVPVTAAFVRYPVAQAADILIVAGKDCRPIIVPVGEDQLPHIELTRDIAKRFNSMYGKVFPEPEARIGQVGRLVGTDGLVKMSKSLGNVIMLSDPTDVVTRKVMGMYTDPKRVRADIPGTVEGNPVFIYHDAFNPNKGEVADLRKRYQEGRVGDVEVKRSLAVALNNFLGPIRQRRAEYERNPEQVYKFLVEGTKRENAIAAETMKAVRKAMGLNYV